MKTERITALYCRISKEDELTDSSSSIETQKAYLSRYAHENRYYNTRYYVDDGYSGANFERPGFLELKGDIEKGSVHTVLTKDLSRLGRDYLTTGYYIEHYFPLHNVRFIAINDQVDTETKDNDFAPFRNIMNEWYARDISKKIRSAYRTKALNGEFTGPYPSYGYTRDPNDKHKLQVNPKQASNVRLMYQLYLNGMSIYGISKVLSQNKVLTPGADLHKRHGVYISKSVQKYPYDWTMSTIISVLRNPVYIGSIVCNRHQTSSFKSKKLKENPESEWIINRNMHESIISKDQFVSVQQLMHDKRKKPTIPHENIFKGKLRCHECGKTLSLSIRPDRGYHKSFACGTYRKYTYRCTSHYVTYNYLVDIVSKKIYELLNLSNQSKKRFVSVIKKRKSLNKKIDVLAIKIETNRNRVIAIDRLVKRLFEKYANDKISEQKFYQLDKSFDLEKVELIKQERKLMLSLDDLRKVMNDVETFYDLLHSYSKSDVLTREDITRFIDKIVVYEKKNKENKRLVKVYFVLIGNV